ncbi:MAG: extracellular solute-binding protein [Alicyclobacillus herbarius]|uniref:extracellular solute-binding protein n=1 Tax=Alicyclobacillus herbarius TaxID=122960 RepID=UPI002353E416|nr:extracellular solute-binding protein [Alicyclobacillus herbarius]MCL6631207.1 extracellular solute-binding protein [Alicyclobacillus herbarius]
MNKRGHFWSYRALCSVCAGVALTASLAGCGTIGSGSNASSHPSGGHPVGTAKTTAGAGEAAKSDTLSVLYAGSMTDLMEHTIRPDVKQRLHLNLEGEGKGSAALAQMIKSNIASPDVFISASPSVNDTLLMGSQNHNLERWYLEFARDQLVIAYSPKSRFAKQLNQAAEGKTDWWKVLEAPGFRFGRTDPKLDPKGVYTLMLFQLASQYYRQPDLEKTVLGSVENSQQVFPEESLLAQLTSGQIDAIVAYRHEAVEWHVPYISLPDAINLSNPEDAKYYAKAVYKPVGGPAQHGGPIVFTASIPSTAQNPSQAAQFIRYLTAGHGRTLLQADGFIPMQPKLVGKVQDAPKTLRDLVTEASKSG